MNRRSFLAALASTCLAPFLPAIAASPTLEQAPLADIIAGRVPLYLQLCNKDGVIGSLGRQLVKLDEMVTFPVVAESCVVTHAMLATEDGSWSAPLYFGRSGYHVIPGDTFNVMDVKIVAT